LKDIIKKEVDTVEVITEEEVLIEISVVVDLINETIKEVLIIKETRKKI